MTAQQAQATLTEIGQKMTGATPAEQQTLLEQAAKALDVIIRSGGKR